MVLSLFQETDLTSSGDPTCTKVFCTEEVYEHLHLKNIIQIIFFFLNLIKITKTILTKKSAHVVVGTAHI